ncbi:DMT family transporter [Oceanimonas doudoroffii]|uniref:EamA family transporter n=1 Tax=Oceanimonas doudoroffii TaxID=84158 RepID=A0A233RIF4_9GAMM|nr:EamA family transporter [Oceanimonas doudoroffii]OXY83170.1 EamA family transporter [Oceanimonas doudoroffii]
MAQSREVMMGILTIVVASVLWGTTGTVASFAENVSALATGAFAMGVGGILLALNAGKALRKDRAKLWASPGALALGGLSVAAYPLAFYSAMQLAGVAIGTVISIASAPLFAVIMECLIGRKKPSAQWCLSFVFGMVGVLLLALGKQQEVMPSGGELARYAGMALGLLAGLTYATYSWVARGMIARGVHSSSAMAGMFGVAALVLLPSLAFTGSNLFATATNTGVALYMAVVPMFLGYLCFSYGLRHVDVSQATLLTLLEPVVAMLLAVVVVGERFLLLGWFGMGLIIVSMLVQTGRGPFRLPGRRALQPG